MYQRVQHDLQHFDTSKWAVTSRWMEVDFTVSVRCSVSMVIVVQPLLLMEVPPDAIYRMLPTSGSMADAYPCTQIQYFAPFVFSAASIRHK